MVKFLPIFCGLSPLITQGLLPTLLSFTFCLETKSNKKFKKRKMLQRSRLKRARLSFQPYAQLSATMGCKRSMELPSKECH